MTSVPVAHGFGLFGKKVLLVDTDEQGHDGFIWGPSSEWPGTSPGRRDRCQNAIHKARDDVWILSGRGAWNGRAPFLSG